MQTSDIDVRARARFLLERSDTFDLSDEPRHPFTQHPLVHRRSETPRPSSGSAALRPGSESPSHLLVGSSLPMGLSVGYRKGQERNEKSVLKLLKLNASEGKEKRQKVMEEQREKVLQGMKKWAQ